MGITIASGVHLRWTGDWIIGGLVVGRPRDQGWKNLVSIPEAIMRSSCGGDAIAEVKQLDRVGSDAHLDHSWIIV